MLKSCMRNATAAARPVKRIGVAEMSVAEKAPFPVKADAKSSRYVWPGEWPLTTRMTPMIVNATTSEPAGTATFSHHGWSRRRSRRITPLALPP